MCALCVSVTFLMYVLTVSFPMHIFTERQNEVQMTAVERACARLDDEVAGILVDLFNACGLTEAAAGLPARVDAIVRSLEVALTRDANTRPFNSSKQAIRDALRPLRPAGVPPICPSCPRCPTCFFYDEDNAEEDAFIDAEEDDAVKARTSYMPSYSDKFWGGRE